MVMSSDWYERVVVNKKCKKKIFLKIEVIKSMNITKEGNWKAIANSPIIFIDL